MELILCNNCGEFKSRDAFYWRDAETLHRPCKQCAKLTTKAWREQNKDHQRNYHQANRDKIARKWKYWYKRNRQNRKGYNHQYYQKYRKRLLKQKQAWRKRFPNKHREIEAKRRARKLGASFEEISTEEIFKRDRGICHLCGRSVDPDDWHLDHIIPLSKGGSHSMDNVAVSHPLCNMRKGDNILDS